MSLNSLLWKFYAIVYLTKCDNFKYLFRKLNIRRAFLFEFIINYTVEEKKFNYIKSPKLVHTRLKYSGLPLSSIGKFPGAMAVELK